MQKQYKLYKMDKNAIDSTLLSLNKYSYEKISDYIIAIQYDYLNNGYKELLETMSNLPVSQYIITASGFYKLLSRLVENELKVYDIKLNSLFEEDNVKLLQYIKRINQKTDVKDSLEALLEILKWYNYDEGIDINHMTFGIKYNKQNCRFHFYNNGILAIDSEKIIEPLFELLKSVM